MTNLIIEEVLVVFLLSALATAFLIWPLHRWLLRSNVLDVPNERSSHSAATPRGGGIAIGAVVLAGIGIMAAVARVEPEIAKAIGIGGLIILAVGTLDDFFDLPAAPRLAIHAVAAAMALYWLDWIPVIGIAPSFEVRPGPIGIVITAGAIVWTTNLYNFMDGIDGIAASQAMSVGVFGAVVLVVSREPGLALIASLLAGSSCGFLAWNWAPARLFMGDGGSGFLGYAIAVIAIASGGLRSVPVLIWMILMGVFLLDSTVTLLRRVVAGERWYSAHRSHAYQRAVQAGRTHAWVTSSVIVINCLLGVLAIIGTFWPSVLPLLAVLSVGMLLLLYWRIERIFPLQTSLAPPRSGGDEAPNGA